METYNIYGSRKKVNYQHCKISKETEKAVLLETTDSEGSYLNEYKVTFWIPKSFFEKSKSCYMGNNWDVALPFYFDLNIKREKIG